MQTNYFDPTGGPFILFIQPIQAICPPIKINYLAKISLYFELYKLEDRSICVCMCKNGGLNQLLRHVYLL